MAEAKEVVTRLENAIKKYDKLADILLYMASCETTFADTLVAIEERVNSLNDDRLSSIYQRLLAGYRASKPESAMEADYKALELRLATLYQDAVVEVNEADLVLKETLAIGATEGIWGPRGWRPSAVTTRS